jgi:hypothetical protein
MFDLEARERVGFLSAAPAPVSITGQHSRFWRNPVQARRLGRSDRKSLSVVAGDISMKAGRSLARDRAVAGECKSPGDSTGRHRYQ